MLERGGYEGWSASSLYSRSVRCNEVRFFAGCAAKKWPPFGAVELRRQGNRKRFAATPKNVVSSQDA